MHNKMLYESSGLYGRSFISYGDLRGKHRQLSLPEQYFAEGLAVLGDTVYLLTWKRGEALLFDALTLTFKARFRYPGEGWGLTHNTRQLIMSDGSHQLRFLEPENFKETHRLSIHHDGQAMTHLNELEWHQGLILANQWQTDRILVIDETSGKVLKIIDLSGLYPRAVRHPRADVFNGIAYDPDTDTWLVTGKYWPRIYRIKLELPPASSVRQQP